METDTCIFYRAMAGGKSVSENYAFAGMHHIFDQHTAAGKFITTSCHSSIKDTCICYHYIIITVSC
jgi:hypothetical protein